MKLRELLKEVNKKSSLNERRIEFGSKRIKIPDGEIFFSIRLTPKKGDASVIFALVKRKDRDKLTLYSGESMNDLREIVNDSLYGKIRSYYKLVLKNKNIKNIYVNDEEKIVTLGKRGACYQDGSVEVSNDTGKQHNDLIPGKSPANEDRIFWSFENGDLILSPAYPSSPGAFESLNNHATEYIEMLQKKNYI